MKKKIIIKFLGLQFSRRDPIFQKLMGPRTPFWKCLAPTLVIMQNVQLEDVLCLWIRSSGVGVTNMNTLRPRQNGRHFQMLFLEWKCLNFKYNLTEVCSYGSNWQHYSIGSDNGLASSRRQAIIWNKQWWPSSLTHICVTRPQWVKLFFQQKGECLVALCCELWLADALNSISQSWPSILLKVFC